MKHIYTHDNIVVLHSVKNILALNREFRGVLEMPDCSTRWRLS